MVGTARTSSPTRPRRVTAHRKNVDEPCARACERNSMSNELNVNSFIKYRTSCISPCLVNCLKRHPLCTRVGCPRFRCLSTSPGMDGADFSPFGLGYCFRIQLTACILSLLFLQHFESSSRLLWPNKYQVHRFKMTHEEHLLIHVFEDMYADLRKSVMILFIPKEMETEPKDMSVEIEAVRYWLYCSQRLYRMKLLLKVS